MSKRPSTPRRLASVGEGSTRLQLMCKIPGFPTRRWGLVQAASPKLAQLCEQGLEIQVYIAGSCWELLGLGIRLHACVIFAGGIVGWEVCHYAVTVFSTHFFLLGKCVYFEKLALKHLVTDWSSVFECGFSGHCLRASLASKQLLRRQRRPQTMT